MSWLSDWSKRIKLTIDNTNVDGTLSGFPVLIKISNSSGITSADITPVFTELGSDANRKKIAVTTSDEITQCYVEIERWDDASEKAELWVKVPTVVSETTTNLYLYYDSTQDNNTTYIGDTTETPAQSVWDDNFKLVMHMAQDPSGGTDAIKDSTSNANHGTPGGAMTYADLVGGKIGKAIEFDGGNDNIVIGSLVRPTTKLTLECLFNVEDSGSSSEALLGADADQRSWQWRIDQTTNKVTFIPFIGGNPVNITSNSTVRVGYHYTTATYDNGVCDLYLDGFNDRATYNGSGTITAGNGIAIGSRGPENTSEPLDGIVDESRISDIDRSAAWIKATYYSNWDELISFGHEDTESISYIAGYVKENIIPITRQIYLHNRDTGVLTGSTTSSGAGGYFYCETAYSGAHYVVCLDDETGVSYNDLIYGNVFPVTISG